MKRGNSCPATNAHLTLSQLIPVSFIAAQSAFCSYGVSEPHCPLHAPVMTTAPATSLHVETPTLADVKSTYPPTPVTARSRHSATSSRSDLPAPPMPEPPLPTKSAAEHAPIALAPTEHSSPSSPDMEDAGHATVDQGRHEGGLPDDRVAPRITIPGIVCAPPDILPPSPPLTVADTREDHEPAAGSSSLQELTTTSQSAAEVPPPMREEDITSWRASMSGETAEKQRELEAEEEAEEAQGEYDPYDLGYSPETPIGPSHARALGMPTGAVSLQQALDHPLGSTDPPSTPPIWELIPPPQSAPATQDGSRPLYVPCAYICLSVV